MLLSCFSVEQKEEEKQIRLKLKKKVLPQPTISSENDLQQWQIFAQHFVLLLSFTHRGIT